MLHECSTSSQYEGMSECDTGDITIGITVQGSASRILPLHTIITRHGDPNTSHTRLYVPIHEIRTHRAVLDQDRDVARELSTTWTRLICTTLMICALAKHRHTRETEHTHTHHRTECVSRVLEDDSVVNVPVKRLSRHLYRSVRASSF